MKFNTFSSHLLRYNYSTCSSEVMEVTVRVEKAEQQPLGIAFRNLPTPPHCQVRVS